MKPLTTREIRKLDKQFVWHPFTQMKEWTSDAITVIDSARGPYLVDTDGRRYLDGVSSLWCNVHGHRVPQIDSAIKRQLGRVAHTTFLGLSNVPAVLLAQRLVRLAPQGLRKVFYSDSGSEAVEIAIKIAYQYWAQRKRPQKNRFIRLSGAYHGDTVGSVSVGGIDLFHRIFKKLLFRTLSVKGPDRFHQKFEGSESAYARLCADRVQSVLARHANETAAIIMEPLVQGAAGMVTHPRGFLKQIRRLADRYGVLLIVDEVATGFGRTGRMFACEHEGVRPDILCVAKGLTGGYLPLAATLVTDEIYNAFLGSYESFKTFFHGHTYTANPLACAAALANLDLFERNNLLSKVRASIKVFSEALQPFKDLAHVGEVRQCGLMAGIELVKDKRRRSPYPIERRMGARVCAEARKHGVFIRPLGNVVVLMPPLSLTHAELRTLCRATYRSILDVT